MAKRIALTSLTLWCTVLLAGCVVVQPKPNGTFSVSLFPPSSKEVTGSSGVATSSTVGGASSTRASANSGPARPGAALTSGSWKVQVESAETPMALPNGARPHGGKRFVVVNVAIQNVGSSGALIVRPNEFRLLDAHGASVAPYLTPLAAYNAQDVRPIDPGSTGYTKFVYDVEANTVYGFAVTPTRGASGSMTWTVP